LIKKLVKPEPEKVKEEVSKEYIIILKVNSAINMLHDWMKN
jgi:hypothetical protein